VPPHPLVKHWLAVARNASTPTPIFRSAIAELGRILIYEAVREFLPTVDGTVDTPMGPADVTCVDPMRPVKVSHSHTISGLMHICLNLHLRRHTQIRSLPSSCA
jgi:uracil phosphoribosyltransferase